MKRLLRRFAHGYGIDMFLSGEDRALSDEFLERGYIVRLVADRPALDWIRDQLCSLARDALGIRSDLPPGPFLDNIHQHVTAIEINDFRLKMIRGINAREDLRRRYFLLAKPYLEGLVGNELAMQLRVNLSIQLPGDDSSLLPLHADTWSGDSPFEVVVWLPLVNCYRTKAMYLAPPHVSAELSKRFAEDGVSSSEALYSQYAKQVKWLDIAYGEVLIFNQALPHGNRINQEHETRWSMNCRFKGVFTPYGDKKLGEFFEPITLRAASRAGMLYHHPGEEQA